MASAHLISDQAALLDLGSLRERSSPPHEISDLRSQRSVLSERVRSQLGSQEDIHATPTAARDRVIA